MSTVHRQPTLKDLERAAHTTRLRLRLQAAIEAGARLLPVPLIYLATAYLVRFFFSAASNFHPSSSLEPWLDGPSLVLFGLLLVLVLATAAAQYARLRSPLLGAHRLDQHHRLSDRVTTALVFSRRSARVHAPLEAAAVEDALSRVPDLKPEAAAPIRPPPTLWNSAAAGVAALFLAQLQPPPPAVVRPAAPPTPSISPLAMHAEDLELLREQQRELEHQLTDLEAKAAAQRFNQLIEDVAARRLDREEVFRRIANLEQALRANSDLDRADLDENLQAIGSELSKSRLSKRLGEALEQKRLPDAETAMRELAQALNRGGAGQADLQRLRQALDAASRQADGRLARLDAERERVEAEKKRLLKKKTDGNSGHSTAQQQEEQRHERELKRLDRQKRRAAATKEAMSELDRALSKAAADLMKEMGQATKDLERGADAMEDLAQSQMSDEEKKRLLQRLEEMRRMLQQQKKEGKQQRDRRLDDFRKRAQGSRGQGKSGPDGSEKQSSRLALSQRSTPGAQGADGTNGPGSNGRQTDPSAQGDESGSGKQWGSQAQDQVAGESTRPEGSAQDVTAAGIDSGEGAASSEVVYGAAEQGFASKSYENIYTEYRSVAEEVMSTDEIPPGYKFYVKRYFQLIRPR